MFGSKLKVKALMLLSIFAYMILPVTMTSADSAKISNQKKNYTTIASIVVQECKKYNHVAPEIILAIMCKESGFNLNSRHTTRSGTQYLGAMQINSRTARSLWKHFYPKEKFEINKFLVPETYVKLGVWHFNNILSHYRNNVDISLTVYNKGAGGAKKYLASRSTYTSSYSRSVIMLSRRYKVKN
jgi:soluble lytic murein transglycosylase-like protein